MAEAMLGGVIDTAYCKKNNVRIQLLTSGNRIHGNKSCMLTVRQTLSTNPTSGTYFRILDDPYSSNEVNEEIKTDHTPAADCSKTQGSRLKAFEQRAVKARTCCQGSIGTGRGE